MQGPDGLQHMLSKVMQHAFRQAGRRALLQLAYAQLYTASFSAAGWMPVTLVSQQELFL